jgi:hypothetical protein
MSIDQVIRDSGLEEFKKQKAIKRHAQNNADLVEMARDIALRLARESTDHIVCSEDVWEEVRFQAFDDPDLAERLHEAHPTWMGSVFSRWKAFSFTGQYVERGSHKRPIKVWKLEGF